VPIFVVEALERPAEDGSLFVLTPIESMPSITGDTAGGSHALWLGERDEEGASPLLYAQMPADAPVWSRAETLATSASAFAIAVDPSDGLHLAYVRDLQTADAPSGVYYRSSVDGGDTWTQPVAVDSSLYYRLATSDQLNMRIAVDADNTIVLAWNDPQLGQALVSQSANAGETWLTPVAVGTAEEPAANARPFIVPGTLRSNAWLIWEGTDNLGRCALYEALVDSVVASRPTGGLRILEDLAGCPESAYERLHLYGSDRVVWLLGGGTDTLALSVRVEATWSETKRLTFSFENPSTATLVYLDDLQATLTQPAAGSARGTTDQVLAVVGTDDAGDVWFTQSQLSALDLAFAPPSPWSVSSPVSLELSLPDLPAVTTDVEGRVHAIWAEPETVGQATTVLRYARLSDSGWTRPTTIVALSQGSASEPSVAASETYLHAVWSNGPDGEILYSRAFLQDAYAAGGWEEPRSLPGPTAVYGVGSEPQILSVSGMPNQLRAIYSVPVNEERGIYYTYSVDDGETWGEAVQVFDAAGAGWAAVDSPKLAVDALGGVHAVWLRTSLSADQPPLSISYAYSDDGGGTWSEPRVIAEGAYAWPRAVPDGLGGVHLFWAEEAGVRGWWHQRMIPTGSEASEQTIRPSRVPGFSDTLGPIGIVGDGALDLHVVGLTTDSSDESALIHLSWTGDPEADNGSEAGAGEWGRLETYRLHPPAVARGVAAALEPGSEPLSLFYLSAQSAVDSNAEDADQQAGVWHTSRAVSVTVLAEELRPVMRLLVPEPVTPTPVGDDAIATEPASAAGQGDYAAAPPPESDSMSELLLPVLVGGGLAAVIVVGAFGTRLLAKSRRTVEQR
jgi:hypothetical protein